jgi:hypothetical protein
MALGDMDQWKVLVNTVMNISFLKNFIRKLLNSRATGGFSGGD